MARATQNKLTWRNNPRLRRPFVNIPTTKKQYEEYTRCANDCDYFLSNYYKVISLDHGEIQYKPFPFQKRMTDAFNNHRFVIAMIPRQMGKALKLDTPIPTPSGWTTMGELRVGDEVYTRDGEVTRVKAKSPVFTDHDCYEITFDTGEKIVADANHEWFVRNSDWGKEKILTTEKLAEIFPKKKKNGSGLYVPLCDNIEYPQQDLPIDPYTLGLWLGDGTSRTAQITAHEDDWVVYEQHIPYSITHNKARREHLVLAKIDGLRNKLDALNLLQNKHIPVQYLRSSKEQRLSLLQGLMDTNGYADKTHHYQQFFTKHRAFAEQIRELIWSLGIKNRLREKRVNGTTYYVVQFRTQKMPVFRLPRKLECQMAGTHRADNDRHYITSIVKVDRVPVQCIAVESETKSFLCSQSFIPTHNSVCVVGYLLWYILFNSYKNVAILGNEADVAQKLLGQLKFAYERVPLWMQQGVIKWNETSIEIENGSKAISDATTGDSIRGQSMNIVFLDEFAHVKTSQAEGFFGSVYPTISSGQTTKMFIVSTPKGMNEFYARWMAAKNGESDFVPIEAHWSERPERDENWEKTTRANMTPEEFAENYECQFLGGVNALISSAVLATIPARKPIETVNGLDIHKHPVKGHRYIITCDPSEGAGQDYTAFVVVDVTQLPYETVAKYRSKKISSLVLPRTLVYTATYYNHAYILLETNGIGSQIGYALFYEYEYAQLLTTVPKQRQGAVLKIGYQGTQTSWGLKTTTITKSQGCANLKSMVESRKLLIEDKDIIEELTKFTYQGKQFKAEEGEHDDLCMALVLFGWLAKQPMFTALTEIDVGALHQIEQESQVFVPFVVNNNDLFSDSEDGWQTLDGSMFGFGPMIN